MKVFVDELPEGCGRCDILGVSSSCCWCPLLLDDNNDCIEVDDKSKRHRDCPLILIERWRLESCKTCKYGQDVSGQYYIDKENDKVSKYNHYYDCPSGDRADSGYGDFVHPTLDCTCPRWEAI